ncbi:hypothetical protein J7E71_11950 [Mesobacillus foraminis]|uniref:hypothetical protein n=1 Tax=Mesobacillus foraminis TaxID=279826 RepID=UPI001BEAEFC7|nr:hypothetical protein [Mesobacillus foraminis]MBT2756668.1 hypothetical protein [Mesobacillus foraminis]
MEHLVQFSFAVIILIIQYFVSKRGNAWLGAILPLIYIGLFVYGYVTGFFEGKSEVSVLAALFGGSVLLVSAWMKGRDAMYRQRKRELNKMKAKDL